MNARCVGMALALVLFAAGALCAQGLQLVLGRSDAGTATGLVESHTGYTVFVVQDEKTCQAIRVELDRAGYLGTRAGAIVAPLEHLPFPDRYANRVVVPKDMSEAAMKEVERVRSATPAGIDDWTHDRHDPSNTAVSAETMVRPPFRTQWIAGPGHATNAVTLVARGRLITIDAPSNPRLKPKLYARDASNGLPLWERDLKTPPPLRRGIALIDDRVCLVDEGKRILVLDAATGSVVKSFEPDEKSGITGRILRVSIAGGVAYGQAVGATEDKLDFRGLGPKGNVFFAMDLDTGKVRWVHRTAKPALERSVCLGGGALYAYAPDLGVIAVNLATGTGRWKNAETVAEMKQGGATGWMTAGSWSVYHGGRLFFYAVGKTVALDAKTGRSLWTNKHYRAPLCVGDRIYTYTRSGDSIIAVDPATGNNIGTLDMPMAMAGCGSGTASAVCIYSAGQGFGTFDFPTKTYHAYNVYRTPCGIGSIAANGMLYTTPFTCNCNYSVTGQVCVAPVGEGWKPPAAVAEVDVRLVKGPAFDRALSPEDADAWETYRGDARHSATTTGKVALPFKVRWQRKLTGTLTAPVAADGRVFVASDRGHVYAVKADTGDVAWTYRCGAAVAVTPSIWRGRVYVGSMDGWVTCFDAATGEVAWKFRAAPEARFIQIRGEMVSTWPVQTGVVVVDGTAYFAGGMCSYDGSQLYALDAATGALKYAKDVGNLDGQGGGINPQGPLASAGDLVIIPTGGSQAAGVRRSDGKVQWWRGSLKYREKTSAQYAKFNYSGGTEVVIEGEAFAVGGPRLIGDRAYPFLISGVEDGYPLGTQKAFKAGKAVLAKNGLLWEHYIPPTYGAWTGLCTPVMTAERVYMPMSRRVDVYDRAKLEAMHFAGPDKTVRAEKEKAAVAYALDVPGESIVLAGDVLVAAGRAEVAAVEDKPDGKVLSRVTLGANAVRNGIAVSAGAVFVVTEGGTVVRAN